MWEWWLKSATDDQRSLVVAIAAIAIALLIPVAQLVWKIFSRPRLFVDFENRPRWRRRSDIVNSNVTALYFRVRVTNNGWTTARLVTGRLTELLDDSGQPYDDFEPISLHWAGTAFGPGGGSLNLLPGQSEYLDVFRVDWNRNDVVPTGDEQPFELIAQDVTPRGICLRRAIVGQTIRVNILAENSFSALGLEFKLPTTAPPYAAMHLSVMHRSIDRFGVAMYPWSEEPPSRDVGGRYKIAGVEKTPVTGMIRPAQVD